MARVLVVALALLAVVAPAAAAKEKPAEYEVGIAMRSIDPEPDGTYAGAPVYLGGYGIASPPVASGRPATGSLGDGISVRAIAFGDGRDAFAIADAEVQGWFAATRDGALGIADVRREVERRTGGALKASQVVVQSNHSHSGPDLMGVWGGAPVAYRRMVVERTVDAIVEAYRTRRRGQLFYGTAPGRDLLSNQFDYDEANEVVDSDVRVLQARDRRGRPFATLLNFSAHATVLGSDNTKASGDWVQAANPLLEERFGGEAVTVVGTLGRTQPADRGCDVEGASGDALQLCKIEAYAARVVSRAAAAADAAQPVAGPAEVAAASYLVTDAGSNPVLLGLLYGGSAAGAPLNRSITPPWMTGNVIGTPTASARIGRVLLSSGPGEMYPQIPLKVADAVDGEVQGTMTAGLANDQLGYLIAPYEAYPEPIRRTFFNQRGDEVSPVDNDNYAFNVSHTMGERVTCSLLRGAGEVLGLTTSPRDAYERCATFANDAALPAGADVAGP